jgi:hypothetical protein
MLQMRHGAVSRTQMEPAIGGVGSISKTGFINNRIANIQVANILREGFEIGTVVNNLAHIFD